MENWYESGPAQYTLRLLQGRSFYLAKYSPEEFRKPYDHCRICTARITAGPEYVTLRAIDAPGQPECLQWDWVCEECFGLFQQTANWTALEGGVDAETHRRYRDCIEEKMPRRGIEDPPPAEGYELQVTWTAEDVVSIAAARGLELRRDQASTLLWHNRRRLAGGMDCAAYEGIGKMLENYRKKPRC